MLRLARRFPQARIAFSGGSGNLFLSSVSEAPIAAQLLEEFGVSVDVVTRNGLHRRIRDRVLKEAIRVL